MSPNVFQPTPEQQAIISHDGSAYIKACPGAGKTRVMIERARHLFTDIPVGRGVAFLSFTQAAIFELEIRLRDEGILPSPIFPNFIGTFDSFLWQFLVAPFGLKDCSERPRLIPDLSGTMVAPFERAQQLPLSCFCPITGKIVEEAAKFQGFDVSKKSAHLVKAYETTAAAIRTKFRERCHLDFDEARRVALKRVKDTGVEPWISKALAARFREVIVDEAQDCNPDDLQIISWLRDSGLAVKVVCDPDQSIFGFRGGVTDQLLEFANTFDEDDRKTLTGNFRSAPNICKSTAQFRSLTSRTSPDEPLGQFRDDTTPVRILSYSGTAVSALIGAAFSAYVKESDVDLASSPVIAATKASGAAAVGQPRPNRLNHRSVRLAEAVTNFHFASGFNDMKTAIDQVHQILLELEGHLNILSYRQYLADREIEPESWRPRVLFLLRALRYDTSIHADAKNWHAAAKDLLAQHLTLRDGPSLSQRLRWNKTIKNAITSVPAATAMPRTIHSVKGMEFPAVCVVTTASTIKRILNYLETGEPANMAEDARKLYVASSRAEQLLVVAAPSSQAKRLAKYLGGQGANVEIEEI